MIICSGMMSRAPLAIFGLRRACTAPSSCEQVEDREEIKSVQEVEVREEAAVLHWGTDLLQPLHPGARRWN